ncbi:hypothetical protein [uncultured Methanoregula sp.]|uniref:hypothetical protein n=1 Tax=uncultured Methanoregula sp. TaxID=1005933 RepID=UPI002AAC02B4|nr:hypothetical protein [uncultured Methanoregula sp.]
MCQKDPGYIVTHEELARIRKIHMLVENDRYEESRRCTNTISEIIRTVEKRRL